MTRKKLSFSAAIASTDAAVTSDSVIGLRAATSHAYFPHSCKKYGYLVADTIPASALGGKLDALIPGKLF